MMLIEWWNALGLTAQIFYLIALPATLVLIIQTVLMFFGFGDEGADAGDLGGEDLPDALPEDGADGVFGEDTVSEPHDLSGLEDLRIFTVRGIVAFFVVFGWVGVAMTAGGVTPWITLPVAFLCGAGMMVALAFLFRALLKLRSNGNADNRNALGVAGKVQLTVPPSRTGEGKVHIMLQGAYVERNAVTDQTEPIPTGSEIVVVGVSGQTDLVVRTK
ncbi:MAG: hypothetical protein E7486_00720 [Ruminococcaceae bacterium]|nr:hypothetical protein [Oscillospiraceae bacterium]